MLSVLPVVVDDIVRARQGGVDGNIISEGEQLKLGGVNGSFLLNRVSEEAGAHEDPSGG